uniref:Uncharacterized protein n=1 Tax=Oryza rufipogon TaxID=4529 RepID=A0A0E0PFC2_ORYRU
MAVGACDRREVAEPEHTPKGQESILQAARGGVVLGAAFFGARGGACGGSGDSMWRNRRRTSMMAASGGGVDTEGSGGDNVPRRFLRLAAW